MQADVAAEIGFHLAARPESWTARDREEWALGLSRAGFALRAGRWKGPLRADGTAFEPRFAFAPEEGRFSVTVPESHLRDRPEATSRGLLDLAVSLAERVEPVYGEGLVSEPCATPRNLAEVVGLRDFTLLGPSLVEAIGWDLIETVPGVLERPIAGGGVLLHLPLAGYTAAWTPDSEARRFEAEKHLGLRVDPQRYRALAGPAKVWAERVSREGARS